MKLPSKVAGIGNISANAAAIGPAKPPHTYAGMAGQFASGATALAAAKKSETISIAFLAAQSVECSLKAFLSRDGEDKRLKADQKLRHNLCALWTLASSEGLGIPSEPPSWLNKLGDLHASPYHLRYSVGVHGIVVPDIDTMVIEMNNLLKLVGENLTI